MATSILQQVRDAISDLNPQEVRGAAERLVRVRLVAAGSGGYAAMEDFLAPATVSREKREEIFQALYREDDAGQPEEFDLEIYEEGLPRPTSSYIFRREQPDLIIDEILREREGLGLALARAFPAFRPAVTGKVMLTIAKENAMFAIATALPNLAPGLQLPWSIPEVASDTAVLTVNQVRMAFLLAAASDRPVGYREQKKEIAGIIAAAFGWRSVARELSGKIPFGAGVVPKAAIAFAGTYVAGLSLERLYRLGYGLTREERRLAYNAAIERGRRVAATFIDSWKAKRQAG
jgi:hypothetical protein